MSTKTKFPHAEAAKIAREMFERLNPFCERLKVAGSLRRERLYVSDIELLFVPKFAPDPSSMMGALFGTGEAQMNDLTQIAINRLEQDGVIRKRPNINGGTSWGPQNKLAVHVASGIPIDFFSTTPENWWVSLVIRTGGKRTNLMLTMAANRRGLRLNAYGSGFTKLASGDKIPCTSEEQVFQLAGVPFKQPRFRQ